MSSGRRYIEMQASSAMAAYKATKNRKRKSAVKSAPKRPDYHVYMRSRAWVKKRQEAFAKYGLRCSVCRTEYDLQVHHKTYLRLGHERLTDLCILCDDCHRLHHESKGRLTRLDAELREIQRQ